MEIGTFTDSRDNQTYKTVKIGNQTWMAENLNYAVKGSKIYDNKEDCDKYGRLYDWDTAKIVCPPGWHLPTNKEWDELINKVNLHNGHKNNAAGKYLKATDGWYLKAVCKWKEDVNGLDMYGFNALPGGYGYSEGKFNDVCESGNWWTCSEYDALYAYYCYMYNDIENVGLTYGGKAYLFSVRCIRD